MFLRLEKNKYKTPHNSLLIVETMSFSRSYWEVSLKEGCYETEGLGEGGSGLLSVRACVQTAP